MSREICGTRGFSGSLNHSLNHVKVEQDQFTRTDGVGTTVSSPSTTAKAATVIQHANQRLKRAKEETQTEGASERILRQRNGYGGQMAMGNGFGFGNVGLNSKKESQSFNQTLFLNFASSTKWETFSSKTVISGRKVTSSKDARNHLINYLDAIGWKNILEIPTTVYKKLVRFFYCNLHIEPNGSSFILKSYVMGKSIELDVDTLATIIGSDRGTLLAYIINDQDLVDSLDDVSSILKTVTINRTIVGGIHRNELTHEIKFLHAFIYENIIPKGGHYDAVSPMQVYVIYCLLKGIKLDLGYVILREMAYVLSDRQKALPFGALLTKIFQYFEVPLMGEGVDLLDKFPRSFPKPKEGRRLTSTSIGTSAPPPSDEGPSMPQPTLPQEFMNTVFSQLASLSTNQVALSTNLASINRRMDFLVEQQQHIIDQQQWFQNNYSQQYPDFTPFNLFQAPPQQDDALDDDDE